MITKHHDTTRSRELHEHARQFLPMGVTGDSRYAPPYPLIFERAKGKWLHDADGNTYLDYHGGFGTAILGYAHAEVDQAVVAAIHEIGAYVGVPNPYEAALAERLCDMVPGAERVALCGGGGSDAIYHCLRLARASTGRTKVLKIEGGYQGWQGDIGASTRPTLAEAGDPRQPTTVSNSAGTLAAVLDEVVVATVNDSDALEEIFSTQGEEFAALLIEPVLYSAGCIPVDQAFLRLARDLCNRYGTVLVFDEVMTGFRNGLGGAGQRAGVVPDLGAFGKAVANGYILSFLAGRSNLMDLLSPSGPVFYSGTFNGHPISVAAAMATLDVLERDNVPPSLWKLGDRISDGINHTCSEMGLNAVCQSYGSVFTVYFGAVSVRNFRDYLRAQSSEVERLNDDLREFLRDRSIYVHKRYINRCFLSAEHDDADVDRTVEVIREFLHIHRDQLAL